jgi:hypothetical protein
MISKSKPQKGEAGFYSPLHCKYDFLSVHAGDYTVHAFPAFKRIIGIVALCHN